MAYTKEQLIEGLNEAAQAGNYDAVNEITFLLDNYKRWQTLKDV